MLVAAALLVAVVILMVADATGSTPARWYALLGAVVVVAGALVVAAGSARRLPFGLAISVLVISFLLFSISLVTATGAWPSRDAILWDEPGWGVAGGVMAVLAIVGTWMVVLRLRRGLQGGHRATALVLAFLPLAVLGSYLVVGSVSFADLVEGVPA